MRFTRFTTALTALTLSTAPLAVSAQDVMDTIPGPFALLVFPVWETQDWQPLRDDLDAEYGDRWVSYSSSTDLNAARNAGGAQALEFEEENRTMLTVVGTAPTIDMLAELQEFYPTLTADHVANFNQGFSLSARSYDDGITVVTLALLQYKENVPEAPEGPVEVELAPGMVVELPEGSVEEDLGIVFSTRQFLIPLGTDATTDFVKNAISSSDARVLPLPAPDPNTSSLMVMSATGVVTINVTSAAPDPGTRLTVIGIDR